MKTTGGTMREKAAEVRMSTERRGGDRGDTHSCIDPEDGGKQGLSNAGEKWLLRLPKPVSALSSSS